MLGFIEESNTDSSFEYDINLLNSPEDSSSTSEFAFDVYYDYEEPFYLDDYSWSNFQFSSCLL
jgi:hypothetical protein